MLFCDMISLFYNCNRAKIMKPIEHSIHCEDPWFSLIRQGVKPVEGRKATHTYKKITAGDIINFSNGQEHFKATVVEVRHYPSLEDYLTDVTVEKALPGVASYEEALKIYHQWSTPEKLKEYGFLGIFVKPV